MVGSRTSQGYWPAFESAFLAEIVTTLRRKGKLLTRSVGTYSSERFRERTDGVESEMLEMSFESLPPHPVLVSFNCWDDRSMWLEIRQLPKSDWEFRWSHEGRVGEAGPAAVADLLLESVQFPYAEDGDLARHFLTERWTQVAISGPAGAVK